MTSDCSLDTALQVWIVSELCGQGSLETVVASGWLRQGSSALGKPSALPDLRAILETAQASAGAGRARRARCRRPARALELGLTGARLTCLLASRHPVATGAGPASPWLACPRAALPRCWLLLNHGLFPPHPPTPTRSLQAVADALSHLHAHGLACGDLNAASVLLGPGTGARPFTVKVSGSASSSTADACNSLASRLAASGWASAAMPPLC